MTSADGNIEASSRSRYKYNYDYVPPLAYSDRVHLGNLPSLRWIFRFAKQALRILRNQRKVLAKMDETPAPADGAESEDKKLVHDAEHILVEGMEELFGFLKSYDGDLQEDEYLESDVDAEVDSEDIHDPDFEDLKEQIKNDKRFQTVEGAQKWAVDVIEILRQHEAFIQGRDLQQYRDLYQTLKMPEIANHLFDDQFFANLRVAGYNPLVIKRMNWIPKKFAITEEKFREAPGFEDDSLEEAMNENRLYLADYELLDLLKPGQVPAPKNVYAPIALFGVPKGAKTLSPIAIQVAQEPDQGDLFGPQDGSNWQKAKTCVESSDGNYHEMISHLGRTHLMIEPFVVATHRNLPSNHRVRILLMPHFKGTIFINGLAVKALVNEKGPVDHLLQGTIQSDLRLCAEGNLQIPFNQSWLPIWLHNRGLDDTEALPFYPYRDDGLLIWDAIKEWVSSYISTYYQTDSDVQNDASLQAWAKELASKDGGRIYDFGEGSGIQTRAYLINALTMIIFTASAGHAAVNFPQSSIMSFTPGVPLAGYKPPPSAESPDAYEWIDMLPDLTMAQEQLKVLYLLGSVYYLRLGQYESVRIRKDHRQSLVAFKRRLRRIEKTIKQRNKTRPMPYPYLLPSKIPQSTNV